MPANARQVSEVPPYDHKSASSGPANPLGHAVFRDKEWFHVYCFSDPADADKFLQNFGGEKFNPAQRGKGTNWARWNKP
jgi:hypothetical protein